MACACSAECSASGYKILALVSIPNTPYIVSSEYKSSIYFSFQIIL